MLGAGLYSHISRLVDLGLVPLPCWGGGKALPATNFARLSDSPPSREVILAANYCGGMAILCGNAHPLGGYVLGIDLDRGPESWPAIPRGFLYLEQGTAPGRWHLFLRCTDQLRGQIDLVAEGHLVAEVKGRGRALRSWPTLPPGKPRGYTPWAFGSPSEDPPTLPALQVAEAIADFLTRLLGQEVRVKRPRPALGEVRGVAPRSGADFIARLEAALEQAEANLHPGGGGWQWGRCPFHDDGHPSFSVNFQLGVWKCWAGCGAGGLRGLALRLGMTPSASGHRPRRIPTFVVEV